MKRGDVYMAKLGPPAGTRPVVIVSRSAAVVARTRVTIAHVTTRVRNLASEVPLDAADGVRALCVITCDELHTIPKRVLSLRVGTLDRAKLLMLDRALAAALGLKIQRP